MYYIIGASGFLGSYIIETIISNTDDTIVAISRNVDNLLSNSRLRWVSCDITIREQIDELCLTISRDIDSKVIYLAALHNPDIVENDPAKAWDTNVTSLSYFVNNLQNVKCLFYPSTDSVYGDSDNGYCFTENDILNPVNTYGKQKCAAEAVIKWHDFNVVRFPFLISPSLSPLKKHFYDHISEKLITGQKIEMYCDSLRSSLSFETAASLLINLIEKYDSTIPKIINVCGDDGISKYSIGLMIAQKLGVNSNLVVPVSMANSNHIFKTPRAKSTLMDNTLIKQILGLNSIKFEL